MATFGEITEPSSRAAWEDWDDSQSGSNLSKPKWQMPLEVPEDVAKFFIFEGKSMWYGVKAKKKIYQEINSIKEADLHLYKTPHANHFVAVMKECDLLICNDVIELIKDFIIRSTMIVTVQEKPTSEYQTSSGLPNAHIIRKITTTNKSNLMQENLPKLEQPNIISGVSAGVFTLREHLGLSATAIVMFMDPQQSQIDDIDNLLQNMDMSGAVQVNPNVVMNSNLYI